MKKTYPRRGEAERYRHEIQEAVAAVRNGKEPEKNGLAWPEGLSRTLLRGLPLRTHTRNTLLRTRLMEGDNAMTVAEILCTPRMGATTVQNLIVGIDEFLDEYIKMFDERPGPADVAAMRLTKQVQTLTPVEAVIIDERVLNCPPTELHTLSVRIDVSISRMQTLPASCIKFYPSTRSPHNT